MARWLDWNRDQVLCVAAVILFHTADPQDPFPGSATSIRPTSPNPFQPLLGLPFSPGRSWRSLSPQVISISSLAIRLKGFDGNERKWFSRHQL